ncbi:low molecular weight phosphotyrosine protein phosphatase [Galbibacter marinus]|uniref:protein-tyrosine-phosphatase n=1 Tax=Galbibacter marinus TaxID=555500 RepID=K2QL17_9FLAO|nr:low molecular weight protein-tyrosine-phosphatase [Galbibacter marinus]EKF55392.1 low molecular weight phosphotyrosine protein phosphatase [Galbibacter marinus]
MTRVLMVCLGNICRSPLAEGILKSKVDSDKVTVDSAGTANYHIGKGPDKRSIATAARYKIDITDQRARQFTAEDFDKFDYIFAMDRSNYNDIVSLAKNTSDKAKVTLMLEVLNNPQAIEVPDPYYGGDSGFEHVFQLLDQATDLVVKKIESH